MKNYLSILIALCLVQSSSLVLAEGFTQDETALQRLAERKRLLKKVEEISAKSGFIKKKEYLSPAEEDPLKRSYLDSVRQRLNQIGSEHYPPEILDLDEGESIVVTFELSRSGDLLGARLAYPSEHKIINDYALHVLELGQPFPSVDAGVIADTVEKIVITDAFHFNGGGNGPSE